MEWKKVGSPLPSVRISDKIVLIELRYCSKYTLAEKLALNYILIILYMKTMVS